MKHFCSGCKNGFDTPPAHKREVQQGGEAFCTKECFEGWLKKNYPEFYLQLQLAPHTFPGNHIKRR